jgi:hypothetical protein
LPTTLQNPTLHTLTKLYDAMKAALPSDADFALTT